MEFNFFRLICLFLGKVEEFRFIFFALELMTTKLNFVKTF